MTEQAPEHGNGKGTQDNRDWQQELITRLAFASLNEQRRARRWNIFFRVVLFAYLFLILVMVAGPFEPAGPSGTGRHAALVDLEGVIAPHTDASADNVIAGLRAAFRDERTAGVILRINSPGGSPVQAGYINDEIKRLRKEHPDTPVYAVVTDICASGGYYVAAAADQIYADKASIVGSIGVLMNGFGFVEAMEKLGIERRLLTAGENKAFMDPFSPMKESDVEHVRGLLARIHQQFIDVVKQGRGERLQADNEAIFSGLVWTGEESLKLGLIDGLASPGQVAREVIGTERVVNFTHRKDFVQQLTERFGMAVGKALGTQFGGLRLN